LRADGRQTGSWPETGFEEIEERAVCSVPPISSNRTSGESAVFTCPVSRCYVSRVENGHTVPAIETLEKLARALEIPLYQLFYEGEEPPRPPNLLKRKSSDDIAWGSAGKEARYLNKLRRLLGKTEEGDRKLLLHMAQKMSNR
jgi:transcriptional regulator with XRE-family HTH domain